MSVVDARTLADRHPEAWPRRVWLSLCNRDEHGRWPHPVVWLRLEGYAAGDPAGVLVGGADLPAHGDPIEHAEAWAAAHGFARARPWRLTDSGAVVWLAPRAMA